MKFKIKQNKPEKVSPLAINAIHKNEQKTKQLRNTIKQDKK